MRLFLLLQVSAGFPQFKKLSGTPSTEVVVLDDSEDNEVGPMQQIQPPVVSNGIILGTVIITLLEGHGFGCCFFLVVDPGQV